VVAIVIKVLEGNKQVDSGLQLATKHALLIAIVSAHIEFSKRVIAKTIGVHVRNILSAILWQTVINSIGSFLWSLFMREKKSDGIFFIVKNVV
jgi:hypothetical protein